MNLVGSVVAITVSDPWDFGTKLGAGPFAARVLQQQEDISSDEGAILVELVNPLTYHGEECRFLLYIHAMKIRALQRY